MPSSSISASAAGNDIFRVDTNTEAPRNSPRRRPRLDPRANAARLTRNSAPHNQRPDRWPAALIACQSDTGFEDMRSVGSIRDGMLIERDEIANRHRKPDIVLRAERVDAEIVPAGRR